MAAEPRVFFAALPDPQTRDALWAALVASGLDRQLRNELFPPGNWHQTFSGRHFSPTPDIVRRLLCAGARIRAHAFALSLNRIGGGTGARIHWEFRARGRPAEFDALLAAVQRALAEEGLGDMEGHRPHVTVSYRAPHPLASVAIVPVEWMVREIVLVEGGGSPYRYRILGRWPLLVPEEPAGRQIALL
jgi:2'-5' RNA ligase